MTIWHPHAEPEGVKVVWDKNGRKWQRISMRKFAHAPWYQVDDDTCESKGIGWGWEAHVRAHGPLYDYPPGVTEQNEPVNVEAPAPLAFELVSAYVKLLEAIARDLLIQNPSRDSFLVQTPHHVVLITKDEQL